MRIRGLRKFASFLRAPVLLTVFTNFCPVFLGHLHQAVQPTIKLISNLVSFFRHHDKGLNHLEVHNFDSKEGGPARLGHLKFDFKVVLV